MILHEYFIIIVLKISHCNLYSIANTYVGLRKFVYILWLMHATYGWPLIQMFDVAKVGFFLMNEHLSPT